MSPRELYAERLSHRQRDAAALRRREGTFSVARIVATVLHLSRKLARRDAMQRRIRNGIDAARRGADAMGYGHAGVIDRLAELYVSTISTLRPRVLVQGNCLYLTQAPNVARIRALLLAAIRAGVLWRQSGGSNLGLLLHRRRVAEAARGMLGAHALPDDRPGDG